MYKRTNGRWRMLYHAVDFEFAKFNEPQIKRLQRLIYMSAVSPETTLQKYELFSKQQNKKSGAPVHKPHSEHEYNEFTVSPAPPTLTHSHINTLTHSHIPTLTHSHINTFPH